MADQGFGRGQRGANGAGDRGGLEQAGGLQSRGDTTNPLDQAARERFEFMKLEHKTARAELLWRLNGIYDVQKSALPLIVALMVALSYAGSEPNKFQKAPLIAGWLLIPFFFSLVRTKMRHHRQRNKELGLYIKFMEMIIYGKFPHEMEVDGRRQRCLSICIAHKHDGTPEYVHFLAGDTGWEHFIRLYRHLLPKIIKELEKAEDAQSRALARTYGLPRTIESMSRIELNYMNVFWVAAIAISAIQIAGIMTGVDIFTLAVTHLGHLLLNR
jgi:hypothetical protein